MARPEIPSLTGLRFWAAMFVVVAHTTHLHIIRPGLVPFGNLTAFGSMGMTLFFVLSGFVIHYNYGARLSEMNPRAIYDFAVARFARLYPLYFIATILSIAPAPSLPTVFAVAWPYYLTMTHDWFPMVVPDGRMLSDAFTPGSWSISLEVLLYILYIPLLFIGNRVLRTERQVLRAIAVLFVFVTAFHLVRAATLWGFDDLWLWYRSPVARLPEFLLGVLVAQIYLGRANTPVSMTERRAVLAALAIGGALLAVALSGLFVYPPRQSSILLLRCWGFAPFCGALIYALARFRWRWSHAMFESRLALRLGDASYSIYLLHPIVLWMFAWQGTEATWFIGAKIAISVIVICTLGVWCFDNIEDPARRFIRRRFGQQKPVPRAPNAANVATQDAAVPVLGTRSGE